MVFCSLFEASFSPRSTHPHLPEQTKPEGKTSSPKAGIQIRYFAIQWMCVVQVSKEKSSLGGFAVRHCLNSQQMGHWLMIAHDCRCISCLVDLVWLVNPKIVLIFFGSPHIPKKLHGGSKVRPKIKMGWFLEFWDSQFSTTRPPHGLRPKRRPGKEVHHRQNQNQDDNQQSHLGIQSYHSGRLKRCLYDLYIYIVYFLDGDEPLVR